MEKTESENSPKVVIDKVDDDTDRNPITDPSPKANVDEAQHEGDDVPEAAKESREEGGEIERKEETEAEPTCNVPEEAPPEIQYSLQSLSEDVDGFMASLKNNSDVPIPDYVDKFLDFAELKIMEHESGESKGKWTQIPDNDTTFFDAVDRLSKLLKSMNGMNSNPDQSGTVINRASVIHQRAMSFLEDEFRFILEESKAKAETDQQNNNHNNHHILGKTDHHKGKKDQQDETPKGQDDSEVEAVIYPGYAQEVITVLNNIADRMIQGGYEFECREVYLIQRRNTLEQALHEQGFQKLSIDEVQKMNWDTLEREIPLWNKTFKDCGTIFFPGESKLASQVFSGYESVSLTLFSMITHCVILQLLTFTEAMAMTKRSTEKLFKMLDMYEALRDNFPLMEVLFLEEYADRLKSEAATARNRLGETAIFIFADLETSIKSDSGKTPMPGGAVHPLTRYTLNYLKYACEYKHTLEQVFKEHSKIERADSSNRPNYDSNNGNANDDTSPFSLTLMRIMDFLYNNLEGKSLLYKDIALSSIFMMNNGRYIVQKIKGSPEIHAVMGDTWCRKRSSDLRNYHKSYQRETCGKLLGCLGLEGLMNNGKIVKPQLKERFKSFNAMFDEIHRTQGSWIVSDEQLQSELRISVSSLLIPAYRSFLGRFSQYLDPGRQTEKYIKFQADDIETLVDEFFDGNPSSSMARRKP